MELLVLKLDPGLPTPARAHPGDAGLDLYARAAAVLEAGEWQAIDTGVAVAIPLGYVGLLVPRSGLALSNAASLVNTPGVIDAGYRGELRAIVINHGSEPLKILRGDRIAQLVITAIADVTITETTSLPTSERGEGGFGSSGSDKLPGILRT